jgi:hypothetical protein
MVMVFEASSEAVVELAARPPQSNESRHLLLDGKTLKVALKMLLDNDPTAFTAVHGYRVGVFGYDIVVYERTWHF